MSRTSHDPTRSARSPLRLLLAGLMFGGLALAVARADASEAALARGDAAYAERGRELSGEKAAPAGIDAAIAAYREAFAAEPDAPMRRWKLLKALFFRGDFTSISLADRKATFAEGQALGEAGLEALAERIGGRLEALDPAERSARLAQAGVSPADAARLYFWTAIHWASWARDAGLLSAVRRGVAGKMHDYARVSAQLEPGYYRGGALRLLSSLHARLPKVPFVSGWVDRKRAIPYAEQALAAQPDDSGNQLLMALTLLDVAPEREDEIRGWLERAAAAEPRSSLLVEDRSVRAKALEKLALLDGDVAATGG